MYLFWGLDTPSSCCSDQQSPCSDDSEDLYSDGCYQVMKEVFINNFGLVAGAFKEFYKFDFKKYLFSAGILGLGIFEMLGIVLSCYLANKIVKMKHYQQLPWE